MPDIGPLEIIIIAVVIMLLFGFKRLPDASRSIGRSLRIFKAETKGLREDDAKPGAPAATADYTQTPDNEPSPLPARSKTVEEQRLEAQRFLDATSQQAAQPAYTQPVAPQPVVPQPTAAEPPRSPAEQRVFNPIAALRNGPAGSPDGSMSLMEHLYELRRRLTIAALALVVGGSLGFLWFNHDPFGLPSLGTILTNPYCSLPKERRATLNGDPNSCSLLATGVFDAFFLQLKVGVTAGIVLSSPVWLSQLWGFITPGLYAQEKKFARIFVAAAAFLFTVGAVLAYYVVAQGLAVLLSFSSDVVTVALSPNDYFGFLIALLIIFGVSFELPLIVVMLNQIGVLKAANLKKWRRGIIMGLFVFAAFATPGTDPISMLALAVALSVLFEIATLIASAHDKRLAKTTADAQTFSDLDDDEVSPLDLSGGSPEATAGPAAEDPRRFTDAT